MKKSWVIGFACMFLLTAVLGGCMPGGGGESSAPTAGSSGAAGAASQESNAGAPGGASGELVSLVMWGNDPDNRIALYEQFNAEHEGRIKVDYMPYEVTSLETELRIALSAGTGPDIVWSKIGQYLDELVAGGYLADLNAYASQYGWPDREYEDMYDRCVIGGKLYGMGYGSWHPWQCLFYNKDMLDEIGMDVPDVFTVDQMVEMAGIMRDNGIQPITMGLTDWYPASLMWADLLCQSVGDPAAFARDLEAGTVKWTSNECVAIFEALEKLGTGNCFAAGYTTQSQEAAINSWANGGAAMLYNGTWWPSSVDGGLEEMEFEIGVCYFPRMAEGLELKACQAWVNQCYGINAICKNPDEAAAFIDYITSEAGAEADMKDMQIYTFDPKFNESDKFAVAELWEDEVFQSQNSLKKINYGNALFSVTETDELHQQVIKLYQGDTTPAAAAAAIQAFAEASA
jgi:ABC-type glycerol-3-phosphate transport system substrate-binding protein